MKINYITIWGNEKEKTWSGTSWSLYQSLSKIVDIKDKGYKLTKIERGLIKLFSFTKDSKGISFNNPFNLFSYLIPNFHVKFKNLDNNIQLQIGDISMSKVPYYVYQDLSVDSIIYMKENNFNAFDKSNYRLIQDKHLIRRNKWQQKIYADSIGVFTMSKWLAKNLVEYTGLSVEKVHHVGGGTNINPKLIKTKQKNNNKVLFVGRDFERKAGHLVVEAFRILRQQYQTNAELYIIGPKSNPLKNEFDGVFYLGDLSYDEISKYFNLCDIFCMPSYFEAYGLVFIEALSFGLPCIGRNDFEMKEFIKDGYNGMLIDDDNADCLAWKMHELLNNTEIKTNVLKDRDFYLTEYSWDTVAKRIKKVMEDV